MTAFDAEAFAAKELVLSPSQLEKHLSCARRWYYIKVLGQKEPQGPAAAIGSHGHEQLEKRYRGEPFESPPHVTALVSSGLLYEPGEPGIEIELELKLPVADVAMWMRVDVLNTSETYIDSAAVRRDSKGIPEILDYKFKNPGYWYVSSTLREDLQLNVYGAALLLGPEARFPDAGFVRLSHVYGDRNNKAEPVKVTVLRSRKELEVFQERVIAPAIASLRVTAACQSVEDTRVNLQTCRLYPPDGCPFSGVCSRRQSKEEIVSDLRQSLLIKQSIKQNTNSNATKEATATMGHTFDSLLSKKRGTPPPPAPVPQAAAPAPTPAPAAAAPPAAAPAVAAPAAPAPAAAVPVTPKAPPPPNGSGPPSGLIGLLGKKPAAPATTVAKSAATMAALTPSTANVAPPSAGPVATPTPVVQAATPSAPTPVVQEAAPVPAPAPEVAAAAPAPVEAEVSADAPLPVSDPQASPAQPRRGRGRPRKDAQAPQAAASATGPVAEPAVEGRVLYVNCVPNRPVGELDTYLSKITAAIREELSVPSVRSKLQVLDFGGWKAVLEARVRAEPPPVGEYCLLDVPLEETPRRILADVVADLPDTVEVVRGMR